MEDLQIKVESSLQLYLFHISQTSDPHMSEQLVDFLESAQRVKDNRYETEDVCGSRLR